MLSKIIILFIIITLTNSLTIGQGTWGKEVFLDVKEKPLRNILDEIRNQAKLNLIFNEDLTKEKILTINIRSSAENVLSDVIKKSGLALKIFNNNSAVIYKNKTSSKKSKAVVRNSIPEFKKPAPSEIIKPTLISNLQLEYPFSAIKDRLEGEVYARLLVSKKGNVSEVTVARSSGYEILDTATINYVKKLKFLPAEINGRSQEVWTTMLVKYNFE